MKRYQIVYSKGGFPLHIWRSTEEEARGVATGFRAAGYSVDVWEHTEEGARKKRHLTRLMMARGKGRNHPAASRARSREPYRREERRAWTRLNFSTSS